MLQGVRMQSDGRTESLTMAARDNSPMLGEDFSEAVGRIQVHFIDAGYRTDNDDEGTEC